MKIKSFRQSWTGRINIRLSWAPVGAKNEYFFSLFIAVSGMKKNNWIFKKIYYYGILTFIGEESYL